MMLISSAWAQDAAAGTASSPLMGQLFGFLPIILIFVIFYFLILRPQNEAAKKHSQLLDALKKGDKVVTQGGLIGVVSKVDGDTAHVTVAKDVDVEVVKGAIQRVLTGEAAKSAKAATPAATVKKR